MTDEEINRKLDTVADHLATLAVGLQRLQEAQERADARAARLEDGQANTTRQIGLLAEALVQLTDAHGRTEGALERLAESQAALADAQAHSDRRLDALIDIVRGGRNGQSQ